MVNYIFLCMFFLEEIYFCMSYFLKHILYNYKNRENKTLNLLQPLLNNIINKKQTTWTCII